MHEKAMDTHYLVYNINFLALKIFEQNDETTKRRHQTLAKSAHKRI